MVRNILYNIIWNTYDFTSIEEFNKQMMQFLIWYNTIKPHSALKKSAPLEFILNQYIKNKQKVQNAMALYTILDKKRKKVYNLK